MLLSVAGLTYLSWGLVSNFVLIVQYDVRSLSQKRCDSAGAIQMCPVVDGVLKSR